MSNSSDEAAALNDAIADEAPEMPDALPGQVDLLRGLYDATEDSWHTTAQVRELTGTDEEHLAVFAAKKDLGYSEYMTEVLNRSVLSIGDLKVAQMPGLIDKLILADRDILFLAVTRVTYGRTKTFKVTCKKCGEMSDIEIDLIDDFKSTPPPFDITKPLPVETLHGEILVKLPTGESAQLATVKAKNDAEINTYMLASAVVDERLTSMEERLEWARALSLGDRRMLISALSDVQVGPKMEEVETQCATCDNDLTIALDWVSLLLA